MLTLYPQGIERGAAIVHSQPYFKRGERLDWGSKRTSMFCHFTWMNLLKKSQQWMKLTNLEWMSLWLDGI
jgi:hypothetical protein